MRTPNPGSGIRARSLALSALLFLAGCGGGEKADDGAATDTTPVAQRGTYLHIVAPSVIRQEEETTVRMRVITQAGLPDYDFEGALRLEASSPGVQFPPNLSVEPTKDGAFEMHGLKFQQTGVQFLRGSVPGDTVEALANPVVVMEEPEWNIYWGDLNGHSDLSSGSRSPGVYYFFARSVGLLDFVALTDNDRLESPEKILDYETFRDVAEVTDESHESGEFVTLLGLEWTSREYGNRLVYFSETPSSLPSVETGVDTPAKLRAAIPEGSVIALPHPSGSVEDSPTDPGAVGTGAEDLTEIYSSLGVFEMGGTPRASTLETPGTFVSDLLKKGFRPGFIATSDTRLTTPGNPHGFRHGDNLYPGGLTAVLAKELTREGVLEALRARRCYATTGRRYLVEFTIDGEQMGSEIHVPRGHRASVYGSLGSTVKWIRMEFVGPAGSVEVHTPDLESADVIELEHTTEPITEPTFLYLRGIDELGGMVWASPITLIPE